MRLSALAALRRDREQYTRNFNGFIYIHRVQIYSELYVYVGGVLPHVERHHVRRDAGDVRPDGDPPSGGRHPDPGPPGPLAAPQPQPVPPLRQPPRPGSP